MSNPLDFKVVYRQGDNPPECPHCGNQMSAHGGGLEPPKTGDIAICLYCTGVSQYKVEGRVLTLLAYPSWETDLADGEDGEETVASIRKTRETLSRINQKIRNIATQINRVTGEA